MEAGVELDGSIVVGSDGVGDVVTLGISTSKDGAFVPALDASGVRVQSPQFVPYAHVPSLPIA